MVEELYSSWSLLGIELKTPVDDFFALLTHLAFVGQTVLLDFPENLGHIFAIIESFAVEALIEGNSKCPDLCFLAVLVVQEGLRSHIGGRSDVVLKTGFGVASNLAVTEIDDFCLPVVE